MIAAIESGAGGYGLPGEVDVLAVYVGSTSASLSLFPQPAQVGSEGKTDSYVKGVAVFEVGKCLSLLLGGNARLAELILSSARAYKSPAWLELQQQIAAILEKSLPLGHHLLGMGRGQLAQAKKDPENLKALYHATQLLTLTGQLIGGEPLNWRTPQVEVTYLLSKGLAISDHSGHAGISRDQALAWAEERLAQLPAKPGPPLVSISPESFNEV